MKVLCENFKFNSALNLQDKLSCLNKEDFYFSPKLNKGHNLNEINEEQNYNLLINNEKINKLAQSIKDLNFLYFKERQNNKIIDKNSKNASKDINKENNEERKNKNGSIDSLSEVKKFKTELCHSWELTGTCKYGLNVSYILILMYLIIVCFRSWSK